MSTIAAQNYGDGTSSVPASAVLEGTAKVYGYANSLFELSSTGYNVSSVTDNGTGDVTFSHTNNLQSSNSTPVNSSRPGSTNILVNSSVLTASTNSKVRRNDSDALLDWHVYLAVFGDLA